jgi:hypothetical protein
MIVTNFTLIDFQNGNILGEADLDSLFGGVHTVLDGLIFNNNKTPLLPDSFVGDNKIPAVINNSLFSVNESGNVVLVSKQSFDDAVAIAVSSAQQAQAVYDATLLSGSVLPPQAGNSDRLLTTNGTVANWTAVELTSETIVRAQRRSLLNFIG